MTGKSGRTTGGLWLQGDSAFWTKQERCANDLRLWQHPEDLHEFKLEKIPALRGRNVHKLPPYPRSYLLTSAGKGKISFSLVKYFWVYINTPGQAPCPGVASWPTQTGYMVVLLWLTFLSYYLFLFVLTFVFWFYRALFILRERMRNSMRLGG